MQTKLCLENETTTTTKLGFSHHPEASSSDPCRVKLLLQWVEGRSAQRLEGGVHAVGRSADGTAYALSSPLPMSHRHQDACCMWVGTPKMGCSRAGPPHRQHLEVVTSFVSRYQACGPLWWEPGRQVKPLPWAPFHPWPLLPGSSYLPPHSDTLRAPARPCPSLLGHGVQLSWPSRFW